MQPNRLFARYHPSGNPSALSQLATELLERQKEQWPQLGEGYRALAHLRVRELQLDGFSVRVQCNPQRMASSGARVDARSIQSRPCFLCLENLPVAQQGVLYREQFLLLCNPAPIFAQHYTISHLQHRPQALAGQLALLLQLAKDLSPLFSVFYNGPQCGASAPDHLHFQACPARAIPIETQIHQPARRVLVKHVLGVAVHQIQNLGREILLLAGIEQEAMAQAFQRVLAALDQIAPGDEEPMLNVICSFQDNLYHVLVFPRRKHRPAVFFQDEKERILLSPAAVDMGGLIITPREEDFVRVEAGLIAAIYREVSLPPETTRRIIALL